MEKLMFDYSKLNGRIREVLGTHKKFANAIGISTTALSAKMNNKRPFDQREICRSIPVLQIEQGSVSSYFFTLKI